ncbi:MAG TPA: hypothetical protein DD706_19740 [Nitrospiraceae bacterium]|nr:hypothetical protein [Nitrospiraceae bacterium]
MSMLLVAQANWEDERGHSSEKHCWMDRRLRINHIEELLMARVKEFWAKVNFYGGIRKRCLASEKRKSPVGS